MTELRHWRDRLNADGRWLVRSVYKVQVLAEGAWVDLDRARYLRPAEAACKFASMTGLRGVPWRVVEGG